MATSTFYQLADGDLQQQRGLQTNEQSPRYFNRKAARSSVTRKMATTSNGSGGNAGGDVTDESDEDDNSTSEEKSSGTNEADAFALSGAQSPNGEQRLAGLQRSEAFMNNGREAISGAEDGSSPDGDYADVENITDDEEPVGGLHNGSLLRAAEQDLIEEFERTEQRRSANVVTEGMNDMLIQDGEALARRLSMHSNDSLSDFPTLSGVDMNDDPFLGLSQADGLYQEMWNDAEDALTLWRLPDSDRNRQGSQDSGITKKRVRFEEVEQTLSRSSSMSSEEDANEAFPDLFAAQDDPAIRQRFGLDVDPDATFQYDLDDAASFYDFDGDEEILALELDEEDSDGDDVSSYNSEDDGDTTDEETPEEQIARMRQMKKPTDRSPCLAPTTPRRPISLATRNSANSRMSTPKSNKGPRLGTFVLDKTRASMSADASGKQIKVYPPTNPLGKDKAFWDRAKNAATSHSSTPRSAGYWSMRSSNTSDMPERPFTAQSTLGSMFNGNLDILRNNDVSGVGAELFPGTLPRAATSAPPTTVDDESESAGDDIDMQEFIDIDDSGSESDVPQSTPVMSPGHSDIFDSFTNSPSVSRNDGGTGLLDHLDQHRGLVGSFRRNQTQAKHVSSLASNAAKRASTSEFNALQKGRRAAANTPMTPARKKHTSQDLSLTGAGVRKFVSSPMAGRRPRSRGGSLSGIHQTLSPSIMK